MMARRKKAVLRLTVGIMALLAMTYLYQNVFISIIKDIRSTVPRNINSSDHVSSFLTKSPSIYGNSPPVRFRDIFDPSKVPNAPIGPDNITDKDRYFIYRCDESTMNICGGWADRIKGAMFAYVVANLTGRTFKMEMLSKSCDMHRFIVPNQVNWYLPNSVHKTVKPSSNVSKLDMVERREFIDRLDHDFFVLPHMKFKYLYFKINREPFRNLAKLTRYQSQLAWMRNLDYPDIFNTVYRRLFKPSTYLLNRVNSFLKNHLRPKSKLVCAHLRTGLDSTTVYSDLKLFTMNREHLTVVWKFLRNMAGQDDVQIFLMSDSEQTIDEAKNLTFSNKFFFSCGKIMHVDRAGDVPRKERCEGYENIIFEQLVLMHCDVLVITRNSGISRVAAYVRGTDDNLYCFLASGELIPCIRNDL